jgi:hypothetical protein
MSGPFAGGARSRNAAAISLRVSLSMAGRSRRQRANASAETGPEALLEVVRAAIRSFASPAIACQRSCHRAR